MTRWAELALLLAVVLLAGCGSDSGQQTPSDAGTTTEGGVAPDASAADDAGGADAPATPGDAPPAPADAPPAPADGSGASCRVAASLGVLGPVAGHISHYDPARSIGWDGALNQDAQPDLLNLQLIAHYGVFTGGLAPGTYAIAGAELNYATCGLCVLILGDVALAGGTVSQYFFATGGTVTLTSIAGRLTGSLENVTFTNVTIDPATNQSTPLGTCSVTLGGASFDTATP